MVVLQQNFPKISGNTTAPYFTSISNQGYYIIHKAEPCDSWPVRPRRVPWSVPRSSAMKPLGPQPPSPALSVSYSLSLLKDAAVTIPMPTCTRVCLPLPRLRLPHARSNGETSISSTPQIHTGSFWATRKPGFLSRIRVGISKSLLAFSPL